VSDQQAGFCQELWAFAGLAVLVSVGYMGRSNWGADLQAARPSVMTLASCAGSDYHKGVGMPWQRASVAFWTAHASKNTINAGLVACGPLWRGFALRAGAPRLARAGPLRPRPAAVCSGVARLWGEPAGERSQPLGWAVRRAELLDLPVFQSGPGPFTSPRSAVGHALSGRRSPHRNDYRCSGAPSALSIAGPALLAELVPRC
jgi:hypothetical protein